jgi:hypothetical protein
MAAGRDLRIIVKTSSISRTVDDSLRHQYYGKGGGAVEGRLQDSQDVGSARRGSVHVGGIDSGRRLPELQAFSESKIGILWGMRTQRLDTYSCFSSLLLRHAVGCHNLQAIIACVQHRPSSQFATALVPCSACNFSESRQQQKTALICKVASCQFRCLRASHAVPDHEEIEGAGCWLGFRWGKKMNL